MKKYRILSLDGGGLRGLLSARLIQRLNDNENIKDWLDKADLFSGTSTGGILALGLAYGINPEELCNLYIKKGKKIFDDNIWDDIRDLGKIVGADYSNKGLKKVLEGIFGNKKLSDLKKRVAIPTFDLDNGSKNPDKRSWKPKIFHNFKGNDSDGASLLTDVAMYTSAAPTYFPSVDGYIDGGVYANNPSIIAIAQAISQKNTESEKSKMDELVMLSIGTGVSLTYIKGKTLDWGYAQWAKPLIDVLMDGVAGISDYQASQLLGESYHRLQIVFNSKETIPMDSVKKIGRIDKIARNHDLSSTINWIKNVWF